MIYDPLVEGVLQLYIEFGFRLIQIKYRMSSLGIKFKPLTISLVCLLLISTLVSCNQPSPTSAPEGEEVMEEEVEASAEFTTALSYNPQPESTVQIIELQLPFTINHEPEGMMPMGETINHPPPMGHPGLDFQWPSKEAEIIVALDGVVGDIIAEISPFDGDTVYIITVVTGDFGVRYEVVDLPNFNPNLQIGDELVYGTILGYPQATESSTWRMIHWGFGKAFENEGRRANPEGIIENYHFDWLCPMEYFTESERLRLEQIWEGAIYNHKDEFPNLCNGYYE